MDFDLFFNDDLNILTGKNGTGKTTIIRLISYLKSGHFDKIISAIDFEELEIETSHFRLNLKVSEPPKTQFNITWDVGNGKQSKTLN